MQLTIFTGGPGAAITQAAVAAARDIGAAHGGTLLITLGSDGAGALLGARLGADPATVAPGLDALAIDAPAALTAVWNANRDRLLPALRGIAGDELPLLPGMGALFGLARLREIAPRYARIILDAGSQDEVVQALTLPDALRWITRLLIGLDRDPGRSPASVARALLPTDFLPADMINGLQETRVEAERMRQVLTAAGAARVAYVLRPDAAGLAEARLGIPALHLCALPVAAIIAGPLLPAGLSDPRLAAAHASEAQILDAARALWPARRLIPFAIGAALLPLPEPAAHAPPITERHEGEPALVIDLPGLAKGALHLTLSGDELIVRVGRYRRHVLLPVEMRGIANIRATRAGDLLVVRRRS
jgi:anion-transporting  ArsA/GET3 family ATPase